VAAALDLDPAYAKARDAAGMVRIQLPYGEPAWLATRYDDVRLVLGDLRFSRAMAIEADVPRMTPSKLDSGIIVRDPPDHTRLRRLVAKAFTHRRVEQMRPRVRELSEGLVDAMVARGMPVDLVEHFALSLPVVVICELIGVPVADREGFREYMSGLIAARRAAPADDLMTALIEARDEHDRLSELELVDMCNGILVAGHETTASHLPNFVHVLLAHPERLAELQEGLRALVSKLPGLRVAGEIEWKVEMPVRGARRMPVGW
jgi:cytochrome P450